MLTLPHPSTCETPARPFSSLLRGRHVTQSAARNSTIEPVDYCARTRTSCSMCLSLLRYGGIRVIANMNRPTKIIAVAESGASWHMQGGPAAFAAISFSSSSPLGSVSASTAGDEKAEQRTHEPTGRRGGQRQRPTADGQRRTHGHHCICQSRRRRRRGRSARR